MKDVDINILFEQSTNESKPKKTMPTSVKKETELGVNNNGPSGGEEVTSSTTDLFGDSDDSDWEGLDGT